VLRNFDPHAALEKIHKRGGATRARNPVVYKPDLSPQRPFVRVLRVEACFPARMRKNNILAARRTARSNALR
jgi:hypothetical protein